MIRVLRALLLLFALPALAQDPVLRAEMDGAEAIPGQPVSLRLTVLVPSYMPDPPDWPSMEAPNLQVRLGASGPTSDRVEGATWSGISRRYLLSPMIPGTVAIPPREIGVTWVDPETTETQTAALPLKPLEITGIVPPGAGDLDPFIAAESLTLEQEIIGEPTAMTPGDSLTRTVTATITGTAPMFLPPLMPVHEVPGLRAYPEEPVLTETGERGVIGGTRVEEVTLVAEGGGSGAAPPIALRWYNLVSGAVEVAELPGIEVVIDGPDADAAFPLAGIDRRGAAVVMLSGVLILCVGALAARYALPPLVAWRRERRSAWMASEPKAWRDLRTAVRARDHARLRPSLDAWARRCRGPDPRNDSRIASALTRIGVARYGEHTGNGEEGWRTLARVLPDVRSRSRRHSAGSILPPLNPAQ